MSKDEKKSLRETLDSLPIQKSLANLQEARERFQSLIIWNELVNELVETDKKIDVMPEGYVKQELVKEQEEAWEMMFSEALVSQILLVN